MPVCRECYNYKTQQQEKRDKQLANQLEVIKFRDDDGEEDSLLVVKKTPNKGTPGQPADDSSLSSIEKGGSNHQSPTTVSPTTFSPSSN